MFIFSRPGPFRGGNLFPHCFPIVSPLFPHFGKSGETMGLNTPESPEIASLRRVRPTLVKFLYLRGMREILPAERDFRASCRPTDFVIRLGSRRMRASPLQKALAADFRFSVGKHFHAFAPHSPVFTGVLTPSPSAAADEKGYLSSTSFATCWVSSIRRSSRCFVRSAMRATLSSICP